MATQTGKLSVRGAQTFPTDTKRDGDTKQCLFKVLAPNTVRDPSATLSLFTSALWKPSLKCRRSAMLLHAFTFSQIKFATGTKIFSASYGCTEAPVIALNLWSDGRPQQYVLMPNENLCEFIPQDLR